MSCWAWDRQPARLAGPALGPASAARPTPSASSSPRCSRHLGHCPKLVCTTAALKSGPRRPTAQLDLGDQPQGGAAGIETVAAERADVLEKASAENDVRANVNRAALENNGIRAGPDELTGVGEDDRADGAKS